MLHAVEEAKTREEIMACYQVMKELRPDLSEEEFLRRVQLQQETQEYHLLRICVGSVPVCVSGYRIASNLHMGTHLYVDDLVTLESARRQGFGKVMLGWLEEEARRRECSSLHLDSGVQRHPAHRLYITAGMDIVYYHFRKMLD